MTSIRRKVTITYTLLFLVIFSILGIYLSTFFSYKHVKDLEKNLISNTELLSGFIDTLERDFLQMYADDVAASLNLRVTILDVDGEVLVETSLPVEAMDNHLNRPEIQSALLGNITTSQRYSETAMGDMIYSAAPIYSEDGEIIGFFRLSKSLVEIKGFIKNIRFTIFLASLLGVLLAWILGRIIASALTKSIDKLIEKAEDFGNGRFNPVRLIDSKDEIAELEKVFNEMGTNISTMMENTEKESRRIENILRHLPVGVMVINKEGLVEAYNSAARDMLDTDLDGINKPLIHLTRDYHVNNFVRNLLKGEERQQTEVVLTSATGEKTFIRLKGTGLYKKQDGTPEEIVVVMQDITDLRRLEQMRKDLVANVSHELRTPVTAISGFAETLLDDEVDSQTTTHFLNIIKEESTRLSRLITDLLNLSKLESGASKRKEGISSLNETAESVIKLLNEKIKQKKHNIILDISTQITLAVEQDYVEQVLVNYMDNAIKYCPAGTTITVSAEKQDNGYARIVVIDNGPGIPEKEQSRLFERFFKVEKSRQSNDGGTGLGLAIVKHIVEGFNGEVGLRSSKDGTAFWATLPYK